MWFRIGINLGDVMQDGGDLYGDGVNVAARLESLADPGGIMVSETVFNLTNRHLAFGYDFAGEQKVKGQDEPIAGYRVRMPGQNIERRAEDRCRAQPRQSWAPRTRRSDKRPSRLSASLGDGRFLDRQLARIRQIPRLVSPPAARRVRGRWP